MSKYRTIDGSEGVAHVAYLLNEVIAIYPITPSSAMGEFADQWASEGRENLWGTVPQVVQMQSEGGVAGALHGALQAGSHATTFTASQGLLLVLPNMYKIAGELTPCVIHVAARSIATHALSIFGDQSDVMSARMTGFAMLVSNSVQEAMDMAAIAHTATYEARIPFMHFFDGFRTSHETNKVEMVTVDHLRQLIDVDAFEAHRRRALSPDHPVVRGTAQNPDVFFQGREASNPYYLACPRVLQEVMDRFADLTGRHYHLFDYIGAPDAERVVVVMGSGAETTEETVRYLQERGERVGVLKVRLYRPFATWAFIRALPPTVRTVAVLDRTKEPGSVGEPLYLDVIAALAEAVNNGQLDAMPQVIGGRYGLSSKEFTPAMVKAVFDEMVRRPARNHFTLGINDDVTFTSLPIDDKFSIENSESVRAVFFGLGSDGTVGANKNTIKIIGEETELHAQGYFIYDSKKSGSVTVSHLRFGPHPIRAPYLVSRASFVACHQFFLLERLDMLGLAEHGATFLLNSPYGPDKVWDHLPAPVQKDIQEKQLKVYVIDALAVARDAGLGNRINTVMQVCFFALSKVLPRERAIEAIKYAIKKSYGKRGDAVVAKNLAAVDAALGFMYELQVPTGHSHGADRRPAVSADAPEFVQNVTAQIIRGEGDLLPVSAIPLDGTFPTGTTKFEKRNIAADIPVWDEDLCIQCGKCVMVCPHSVIRGKLCEPEAFTNAPAEFKTAPSKFPDFKNHRYALQVAPEDCTGCALCVEVCPAKAKGNPSHRALNMEPIIAHREAEIENWDFFLKLPEFDRNEVDRSRVKEVQLLEPLFEFSGACSGCGETPYIKVLTQLYGDRAIIANATGCSSIYGGNLPTAPWTTNEEGRGPAWANSLFEDNAEFGYGIRVAVDKQIELASERLRTLAPQVGIELAEALLNCEQKNEEEIVEQRARVAELKQRLLGLGDSAEARDLRALADTLVRRSVWIVGGDGWAYDIDYGGLDHVIASGRKVNILVLDTEVYSNTGGQASKSTPMGAIAKFASGGKKAAKKDLALLAMSYGSVYVARIALGANDAHTLKVFQEAEAFPGPSLIIAYSHCIAHGIALTQGPSQQKAAVESGHWPLIRFNPSRRDEGLNPLQMDSKKPSISLEKYLYSEGRYSMLVKSNPEMAAQLLKQAEADVEERWRLYTHLAELTEPQPPAPVAPVADGNGNGVTLPAPNA